MKTQETSPKSHASETNEFQGKTMAPPSFSLEASPAKGGGGEKKPKDHNKEPKKGLFAKTAEFQGPMAEKGEGDGHAFAPNDVSQGMLGDCFFMASLISIANVQPERLEEQISQNEDGSFCVRLSVRNEKGEFEWKRILVDPIFVTDRLGNPKYAERGDGKEVWVMVFEKAYAQLEGSYHKLQGGDDMDAMQTLTGKEADRFYMSDANMNETLEILMEMKRDKMPVTASTHGNEKQVLDEYGERIPEVVSNHSYAVIDANRSQETVTIQNPWDGASVVTITLKQFMRVMEYVTYESKLQ